MIMQCSHIWVSPVYSHSRTRVKLKRVFVRFLVSPKVRHVPLGVGGHWMAVGLIFRAISLVSEISKFKPTRLQSNQPTLETDQGPLASPRGGDKGGQLPPPNRPWTRFWDSCKSDEKCEHLWGFCEAGSSVYSLWVGARLANDLDFHLRVRWPHISWTMGRATS